MMSGYPAISEANPRERNVLVRMLRKGNLSAVSTDLLIIHVKLAHNLLARDFA